jgi:hypothetical protein
MEGKRERVRIHAQIKSETLDFEGSADETINVFLRFISTIYPAYELVSKLTLTIDFEKLLKDSAGVITIAPEGPVLLRRGVSTADGIKLCLIGAYIGFKIGKLSNDTLSCDEMARFSGKSSGTIANELTKMTKQGLVDRVGKGEYKITTTGIVHLTNEVLPRLKEA